MDSGEQTARRPDSPACRPDHAVSLAFRLALSSACLRASASPSDSARLGLARARHADCHGRFFPPRIRGFRLVDSRRRARYNWRCVASPAAVCVHYTAELQWPCGPHTYRSPAPRRYPFAGFGSPVGAVGWTDGRDSFTRAHLRLPQLGRGRKLQLQLCRRIRPGTGPVIP